MVALLDRAWRMARRWARENARPAQYRDALEKHTRAAERAALSLRIAYYFPLCWVSLQVLNWQDVARPRYPDLLWPVSWLAWLELPTAGPLLVGACLIGVMLGAFFSEFRWARVLACLGLLEFLALKFSLGKIHHLMHGWLLLLATLIWLPRRWHHPGLMARATRHELLLVYVGAQLLVGTTYTLAGIGKILGAAYQATQGEITALHPSALSRHVAARLLETGDTTLWGPWLIERGAWLWPLMLGTLYLQVFAVSLTMRPRLHGLLGFGLVAFHVLAPASLAIDFTPAVMLCGLLYACSAVRPERWELRELVLDLPLFGSAVRRFSRRLRRNAQP